MKLGPCINKSVAKEFCLICLNETLWNDIKTFGSVFERVLNPSELEGDQGHGLTGGVEVRDFVGALLVGARGGRGTDNAEDGRGDAGHNGG
jgi:hypothetical protein